MKQIFAIILSVLFLLPSIGVHFDLSYCCGNLEEVGMLHSYSIEVNDCPVVLAQGDCMAEVEIISEPTYLDFLDATELDYSKVNLVSEIPNIENYSFKSSINKNPYLERSPPLLPVNRQVLFQSFLC